jgi:hypothetical protein
MQAVLFVTLLLGSEFVLFYSVGNGSCACVSFNFGFLFHLFIYSIGVLRVFRIFICDGIFVIDVLIFVVFTINRFLP